MLTEQSATTKPEIIFSASSQKKEPVSREAEAAEDDGNAVEGESLYDTSKMTGKLAAALVTGEMKKSLIISI